MKISTDSHLTALFKAITRFFGIDIFVTVGVLFSPTFVLSWMSRNLGLINSDINQSSIYAPYLLLAVIFIASSIRRNTLLVREGLQSTGISLRALFGNLLVVATVVAIWFKRNLISPPNYLVNLDRTTVAIDLLFIWVITNFLAQLILLVVQFFQSSKG